MDASTLHGVKPESHEGAWDGGGETHVITRTKRTTDSTKVHPGIGVKVVTSTRHSLNSVLRSPGQGPDKTATHLEEPT